MDHICLHVGPRPILPLLGCALLGFAAPAGAADAQSLPPEVQRCAEVKKNSERLVCYDTAVAHLLAPPNEQTTPPSAESLFGIPPAKSVDTASPVMRQELQSVTARVSALGADEQGSLVIRLDNGQAWQQLRGTAGLVLKVGDQVTITRAALNSFRISTPTGRAAKVRRIQ